MTYTRQWPTGSGDQRPAKPIHTCTRPGCGAEYTGDSHVCRNPAK